MPPSPAPTSCPPVASPPPVLHGPRGGATSSHLHSSRPHRTFAAATATIAALAAMLHRFPPASSGFYPRCPLHLYTGLLCPGCGATRALAALTQGDLVLALHWNALVTLLLPLFAVYGLAFYLRAVRSPRAPRQPIPVSVIAALLAVTVLFTVFRNLP